MTRPTRRIAAMSPSGSPSTAIRSARLPGSRVPTSSSIRQASAPQRVPASSASRGDTPKRTSVSSSNGMQAVHAVGARTRSGRRRRGGAGSVSSTTPPRPAHLLHDRRALAVALLDARRVHEDRERADEPGAALDHQRDVLVVGERAVLDRATPSSTRQPEARAAVGVGGGVRAGALGLLDGGADLLARVGARRRACVPGELTPPVTKIFTWSAPRWKFSRTPRRTSSTPSKLGERAAVAVAGGDARAPAHEQARARDRRRPRSPRAPRRRGSAPRP